MHSKGRVYGLESNVWTECSSRGYTLAHCCCSADKGTFKITACKTKQVQIQLCSFEAWQADKPDVSMLLSSVCLISGSGNFRQHPTMAVYNAVVNHVWVCAALVQRERDVTSIVMLHACYSKCIWEAVTDQKGVPHRL